MAGLSWEEGEVELLGLFWTRTDQRASTPSETQALSRHQSTYAFEIGRRNTDVSQARKSSAVPGGAMWPCGEGRELWDTEELREVGRWTGCGGQRAALSSMLSKRKPWKSRVQAPAVPSREAAQTPPTHTPTQRHAYTRLLGTPTPNSRPSSG